MSVDNISAPLFRWYRKNRRPLAWRRGDRGPYETWLVEIMAQQTTAAAAERYWQDFLGKWPTVEALADARDEDVMHAWAGLGYYARARNLLKTARAVAGRGFPDTADGLRRLPGIGPYTANAILAIAHNRPVLAADTNIERIACRLFASNDRKVSVARLANAIPAQAGRDFNEALMDLGAGICTARNPECGLCPLAGICAARRLGRSNDYPAAKEKKPRKIRFGAAWWIERGGKIALVRRPATGLLGGMLALPGTAWEAAMPRRTLAGARQIGTVTHIFTHIHLTLSIEKLALAGDREESLPPCLDESEPEWWPAGKIRAAGLPTLYRKAVAIIEKDKEGQK